MQKGRRASVVIRRAYRPSSFRPMKNAWSRTTLRHSWGLVPVWSCFMKAGVRRAEDEQSKLKEKEYDKQLRKLQVELCYLLEWVKETGARIILLFEGRDAAGKGGIIKAITERVSARVFKVVALPAPSEREKTQMFIQRYITHFPAAGEILVLDRSWYNRAGVEYVMKYC